MKGLHWAVLIDLVSVTATVVVNCPCAPQWISLELLRQLDIIFVPHLERQNFTGDLSSCQGDKSFFGSVAEIRRLTEFDDYDHFENTLIIVEASGAIEEDIICHISVTTANKGLSYVIVLVDSLKSIQHESSKINVQNKTCWKNMKLLVISKTTLDNESGVEPAALQIFRDKEVVKLQMVRIALPLKPEVLQSIVHIPGSFQNISLKVVGAPMDHINPSILSTETVNGTFRFVGGLELEIINYLSQALNFSFIHVKDPDCLHLAKNGSWSGIVTQVESGKGDVSISSCEMIPLRQERISFLHPTYTPKIYAFIATNSTASLRGLFINCFDSRIWISLLSFWMLSFLLARGFAWFKDVAGGLSMNDRDIAEEAFLFTTGAVCQQGWHISPDSVSMRLVILASFVTYMVCYAAFTATLVSILSTDQSLINSLSDLTKFHYKIYGDKNVYSVDHILDNLESNEGHEGISTKIHILEGFRKIYSQRASILSFPDYFYPQLKVYLKSGNHFNLENEIQNEICKDIQKVSLGPAPLNAGIFLRKKSHLRPYLNQKIALFIETGMKDRFTTTFLRHSEVQCGKDSPGKEPMGISDILPALFILVSGILFSFLMLMAEKFYKHFKRINLYPIFTLNAHI